MNTMISGTSLSELHKALAGFNGSSRTLDADAIRGMDWMYGSAGTIKARLNERVQELHRLRLKVQEPLRTLPNRGWADEEDAGHDERLNPDATCASNRPSTGLCATAASRVGAAEPTGLEKTSASRWSWPGCRWKTGKSPQSSRPRWRRSWRRRRHGRLLHRSPTAHREAETAKAHRG